MLKLAQPAIVLGAALLFSGCCCPLSGRYAGGCCPDYAGQAVTAAAPAGDCPPGLGGRHGAGHDRLLARQHNQGHHRARHLGEDDLALSAQHADYVSPLPRFHPVPTHPVFEPQPAYPAVRLLDLPSLGHEMLPSGH